MTVEVVGIDGVRRALAQMGPAGKKHARKAVRSVADAIVAEAKPGVPVDQGVLRAAIVARTERDVGGQPLSAVKVKRSAFYWRFLEYGQGPDGVEHAFFMRAKAKVLSQIDSVMVAGFIKSVLTDMRKRG